VANRLLRTYGEAIGLDPDFTVMDQSDAEDLMDVSRHNLALGSKEKRFPCKQTCLAIYSRCVNSSDRLDHTLAAFFQHLRQHGARQAMQRADLPIEAACRARG
jgi:ATP-dependent DNA helicase UvrD/PcrA